MRLVPRLEQQSKFDEAHIVLAVGADEVRVEHLGHLVHSQVDIDLVQLVAEREENAGLDPSWTLLYRAIEALRLIQCTEHVPEDDLMSHLKVIDKKGQIQVRVPLLGQRVDT